MPEILVIEDDPTVRSNVAELLELEGFIVHDAPDGEAGLSMAKRLHPDLIVSDWMMPKLDGPGVLHRIRADAATADIPFIFLTALSDRADIRFGMEMGADDYLVKPFTGSELLRTIESRLEKKQEVQQMQEDRLRALLRYSHETHCIVDGQGIVQYAAPNSESVLGVTPERLRYTNIVSCARESFRATFSAMIQRSLSFLEVELSEELQLAHPSRDSFAAVVTVRALFDDPTVRGILVSMRDISDKKSVEAQLQRMQRMDSIGAIACGVAHDLNNVFSPILLSAHVLRKNVPPDREQAQKILDVLENNSKRGSGLVQQLLAFTRGDTDGRQLLNVKHLVLEVRELMKQTFPENIRVSAEYPASLHPVVANPTHLFQVLLNLSVNARDAMPDGGTLVYTIENVERTSDFPETNADHLVCIRVKDTGTGIPDEIKDKLLQPFFTTKEPGKGTGLGLSTIASIIKEHHGILKIESEVGKGSEFSVYLPAVVDARSEAAAGQHTEEEMGSNEVVLLVDEDPSMRELLRITLEQSGYRFCAAVDGNELRAWTQEQLDAVDVVLLDYHRPFISARETAQLFSQRTVPPPIILLSADPTVPDVLPETLSAKMLLRKPFAREEILRVLSRFKPEQP